jgi:hypothetical protein
VIGNAVKSMRILTGEEPEDIDTPESRWGQVPALLSGNLRLRRHHFGGGVGYFELPP